MMMPLLPPPTRRFLLLGGAALAFTSACSSGAEPPTGRVASSGNDADAEWAKLTEEDWRARLTDIQFKVLRKEATERAFTSPLNDEKREGVFHCAGCDLPLFTSKMKYNSGTGWPSFWTHIEGALETKPDHKLWTVRTEYHCRRCGGHQGHVFNDGPKPTRERWCNNGVALTFRPA